MWKIVIDTVFMGCELPLSISKQNAICLIRAVSNAPYLTIFFDYSLPYFGFKKKSVKHIYFKNDLLDKRTFFSQVLTKYPMRNSSYVFSLPYEMRQICDYTSGYYVI